MRFWWRSASLTWCAGHCGRFPGSDFVGRSFLVGNAAVEALGSEDAEFGFGQIKPAAVLGPVVPFEAFDQPFGFGSGEGFVE